MTPIFRGSGILAGSVAALVLVMGTAIGADPDELMPGKVTIIKPGVLAKFVAKPPIGGAFDLPDAANFPTTTGGSLHMFDTSGPDTNTYALPSPEWKGLGNPPGATGFKY